MFSLYYISTVLVVSVYGWMNAMDQPLSFMCPLDTAIYEINSKHDNYFEDRVFEILCRTTGKTPTGCHWTGELCHFILIIRVLCSVFSYLKWI